MTLDEHIHKAEEDAKMAEFDTVWGMGNYFIDRTEALEYAKECRQLAEWLKDYKRLLEQEPSGDAVSRDFQIGDEVRIIGSDPIYDDCDVGWVIRNASERVKTMYVMRNDGSADEENKAEWYKTGRHNAMLAEVIKQLPSVKPQERTGHWNLFHTTEHGMREDSYFKCNRCNYESYKEYNFCPDCGAKMVELQESEVQE